MTKETNSVNEDEINLYDYWKVIVKRKRLIIGLFLISVITTTLLGLLMPKIYKGEAVFIITAKELITSKEFITAREPATSKEFITAKEVITSKGLITAKEIVDIIEDRKELVFAKNPGLVERLKIAAYKSSTDKLKVTIEAKRMEDVQRAISVLAEYIGNHPIFRRKIEQEREKLLKQAEEISKNIKASEDMLISFKELLKTGKLVAVGFNPIDLNKNISNLKIEKIIVRQAIENLKGVEVLEQNVSSKPIKPRIMLNIALAGIVAIFIGILLVSFMEYIERIRSK